MRTGILWLVAVFSASGCIQLGSEPATTSPFSEPVAMHYDPVQCLGNPWERENGTHDDDGTPDEGHRITAYYATKGIHLTGVHFEARDGAVCAACSCPRGDRVHASVAPAEVGRAQELGWTVTEQESASPRP